MTDRELIDRYIAEHGVTQCPVGICAPTTGVDIGAVDRELHRARGPDPAGEAYRALGQSGRMKIYWARRRLERARR